MDISIFMESFKDNLLIFNDNLLFLGIQGSYGRGEAKETSDIDPVIILQQCGKDDILKYRAYIDTLPEKDILCGFISSIDELRAWESADRAQLVLDTRPLYGNLEGLCPPITGDDIRRAVLQGVCAIYHASSHNILHARDWSILPELYKSSRFTIRMKHYLLIMYPHSENSSLLSMRKKRQSLKLRIPMQRMMHSCFLNGHQRQ